MIPKHLQPSIVAKLKRAAKVDLIVATVFMATLTLGSLAIDFELVETLYELTREYERWDLDELLMGLVWLGLAASFFAFQRVRDISKLNRVVIRNAYFDGLTDLPNRRLALDRLSELMAKAKRRNSRVAVLFVDFDKFKAVNDDYGHEVGDLLIRQVGERLNATVRQGDVVARLGGDEFLVLSELKDHNEPILPLVHRLQDSHNAPFQTDEHRINIKFSIGIAIYPDDGVNVDDLIKAADTAMYAAKKNGIGSHQFYSSEIGQQLSRRYYLANHLKQALLEDELFLVYQPIVTNGGNDIVGYEALLRWQLDGELVNPELLISVAEEYGLITEVGRWVLRSACIEAKRSFAPSQFISINVSVNQFLHREFVDIVEWEIAQAGLDAERVELEITESAIISDLSWTAEQLERLKVLGIKIAIDDFGMGYSSFGRLRTLQVDKLKIDRSFIAEITSSEKDRGIVDAILVLARKLNMTVVAEGVETEAQAEILTQKQCASMQGYLFSKPLKAKEIVAALVKPTQQ